MQNLRELQSKELPTMTDKSGHTWTPRIPREFKLNKMIVRICNTWLGSKGTQFVSISPIFAMHLLHCPGVVKLTDLQEV